MTSASTISEFTDCVFHIRVFVFFVRPGFIVIGVTARAIRLKASGRPGRYFIVSGMTIEARHIRTMITGENCRRMSKVYIKPVVCIVALVTLH